MKPTHLFPSILMFIAMAIPSFSNADTPAATDSGAGIKGTISVTPAQPGPSHVGEADLKPLPNTTWAVNNQQGEVTTFTTDADGRFQVSLPPGHYTISLAGTKHSIGKFGPFEVDVVAGKMTDVNWQCDSGIR